MKSVLLIGLGRFGKHIAIKLSERNQEVMAVDKEEKRVEAILPYATNAVIGDSTDENFMSTLGVSNYDVCIVTIDDDFQASLETTSLLKELGAKKVVARAVRDVHEKFLLRNGADEVVYLEKELASWMAIRYTSNHVFDYIELDNEHSIFEVEAPAAWLGKSIGQIDVRKMHNINIMGIKRNGNLKLSVTPETLLDGGETLLVLGTNKAIQRCFHI